MAQKTCVRLGANPHAFENPDAAERTVDFEMVFGTQHDTRPQQALAPRRLEIHSGTLVFFDILGIANMLAPISHASSLFSYGRLSRYCRFGASFDVRSTRRRRCVGRDPSRARRPFVFGGISALDGAARRRFGKESCARPTTHLQAAARPFAGSQ